MLALSARTKAALWSIRCCIQECEIVSSRTKSWHSRISRNDLLATQPPSSITARHLSASQSMPCSPPCSQLGSSSWAHPPHSETLAIMTARSANNEGFTGVTKVDTSRRSGRKSTIELYQDDRIARIYFIRNTDSTFICTASAPISIPPLSPPTGKTLDLVIALDCQSAHGVSPQHAIHLQADVSDLPCLR